MTEKIYYENIHQTEFTAGVLDCRKDGKNGLYAVILDRTAFFPEEGGQSADRGTLSAEKVTEDTENRQECVLPENRQERIHPESSRKCAAPEEKEASSANGEEVLDVKIKDDTITHYLKNPMEKGTKVRGKVDWNRRFDFMQQHSGEHLLSGAVHRHFGFDNVGFHLSENETTLDFNGALSLETLREMEREVNEIIWKDIPVKISFPDAETLGKLEYRSKLELTENVRIVEFPGADVCACCAPHVDSTGQIGLLKITNVQSYKGGVRLNIVCGNRALTDYSAKQDGISEISVLLSAKQEEAAAAVRKLKERENEEERHGNELQAELLKLHMTALSRETEGENAVLFAGTPDAAAMRNSVNELMEKYKGISAVFSGSDKAGYSFVLGSPEKNCSLLAEKLRKLGFKCGGQEHFIQGSVKKTEEDIREILMGS